MRRLLPALLMGPAIAWLLLALVLDLSAGRSAPEGDYDAIIVAGCRVMPDGAPSDCLATRTDRAVALWDARVAPRLVFTGGVGDFGPSEAEVAARRALAAGVDPESIVLEGRSTSTEENARYAARQLGGGRVLVVTDAWHTHRTGRVFGRYFDEVDTVGVDNLAWPRMRGALREVAAVGWYGVTGRLGSEAALDPLGDTATADSKVATEDRR